MKNTYLFKKNTEFGIRDIEVNLQTKMIIVRNAITKSCMIQKCALNHIQNRLHEFQTNSNYDEVIG